MKERAYRTFILSSSNMLSCIDGDTDRSDKLFRFVSTPIEALGLSCSGVPQQVAPSFSQQIGKDHLCYGQCGFGGLISDIALGLQSIVFKGVVGCLKLC